MVTQTIRVNLNQKDLETILAVQSDTLREIAFEFYATDAEDAVQLDPDEYEVKFNVLKPDNNFVMTTFTDGVIKLSDQITAVTGTGYYCILLMQDDELIYSGNGKIIINDHVIGTENIDSVSEADGYTFPDDFYTKDTPLAVLDDSTTSTTSTWSSNKINGEINTASTSAIAQLNAMKTGFDGVVYDSPAAMVRGCDEQILNGLLKFVYAKNLFNPDYGTLNEYIDADGSVKSSNGWFHTDYIEVPKGARGVTALNYVTLHGTNYKMNNQWIATYDKDKQFISMLQSKAAAPDGLEYRELNPYVKYIIVDSYKTNFPDAAVIFDQVNEMRAGYDYFRYVDRHDAEGAIGLDGNVISSVSFGYTDYIYVPQWANRVTLLNKVHMGNNDYTFNGSGLFAEYNEQKEFIETIKGSTTLGYDIHSIDPSTVRYIRVNYGFLNITDACVIFTRVESQPTPANQKWNNKTGDFLGDSITEGNEYTSKLNSLYGITINNYGKSGTTISNINGAQYFATRIPNMSESCDFVFMLGGTNDWGLGATLGTESDTTLSTFYGALYYTLNALREKFPLKPIFVGTIPQRNWQGGQQSSGIDSNANGNSVMEFNEAIFKMAHRFGAVVIDLFGESGICVGNLSTYSNDNLHPNAIGGTRMAVFIKDMMEEITPY